MKFLLAGYRHYEMDRTDRAGNMVKGHPQGDKIIGINLNQLLPFEDEGCGGMQQIVCRADIECLAALKTITSFPAVVDVDVTSTLVRDQNKKLVPSFRVSAVLVSPAVPRP